MSRRVMMRGVIVIVMRMAVRMRKPGGLGDGNGDRNEQHETSWLYEANMGPSTGVTFSDWL